jgi:hypothetical protein
VLIEADSADHIAQRGVRWMLARFQEFLPSSCLRLWSRVDRSEVAIAELALVASLGKRLCLGVQASLAAQLISRIRGDACPELLSYFTDQPSRWFRPLLVLTGALAASGEVWEDGVRELRAHLRNASFDLRRLRSDQVLEIRYWLAKCGLLPGSFHDGLASAAMPIVDVIAKQAAGNVASLDVCAAYALTHWVFYMTDFGECDVGLPASATQAIHHITRCAAAARNIDVLAEGMFASWCLSVPAAVSYRTVVALFGEAQGHSGAVRPHPSTARKSRPAGEVELCFHSTAVVILACIALSRPGRSQTA